MSNIELLCLGNPLLDLQTRVSKEFLDKYDLKENDAILIEEKHRPIFDEVLAMKDTVTIAGGAAQNAARGAAYMLGPGRVAYIGSVGRDVFSEKLLLANKKAGVVTEYMYQDDIPTGKCAALLHGNSRSLVTDLAAANHYKVDHLRRPDIWKIVEQVNVFYVGGFHFTVCPAAIVALGKHAAETNKTFSMNLSAPFIASAFTREVDNAMPYCDYLISNEDEARAYATSHELGTSDLEQIAAKVALMPKTNAKRSRVVIFTHGLQPTVVAIGDAESGKATIAKFPVYPLDQENVVDTNGAGDAFAGGFLSGVVKGEKLETCIDMGQWLARESIQLVGPSFPDHPSKYQSKAL